MKTMTCFVFIIGIVAIVLLIAVPYLSKKCRVLLKKQKEKSDTDMALLITKYKKAKFGKIISDEISENESSLKVWLLSMIDKLKLSVKFSDIDNSVPNAPTVSYKAIVDSATKEIIGGEVELSKTEEGRLKTLISVLALHCLFMGKFVKDGDAALDDFILHVWIMSSFLIYVFYQEAEYAFIYDEILKEPYRSNALEAIRGKDNELKKYLDWIRMMNIGSLTADDNHMAKIWSNVNEVQ